MHILNIYTRQNYNTKIERMYRNVSYESTRYTYLNAENFTAYNNEFNYFKNEF